jgi:hypothetical protein
VNTLKGKRVIIILKLKLSKKYLYFLLGRPALGFTARPLGNLKGIGERKRGEAGAQRKIEKSVDGIKTWVIIFP